MEVACGDLHLAEAKNGRAWNFANLVRLVNEEAILRMRKGARREVAFSLLVPATTCFVIVATIYLLIRLPAGNLTALTILSALFGNELAAP
jgi:hypothetical protein